MTSNYNAKDQAIAQYNSVAAMVAALNVDYDRMESLKDEQESLQAGVDNAVEEKESTVSAPEAVDAEMQKIVNDATQALREWNEENGEELAQLMTDAGDNTDEDRAREAIQNDALDVQVREDWKNPGEESTPSEFMILLCTGGPAVRIMGDLDDYMTPCRAYIEYQDWGTPWTMLDSTYVDQATLLEYCQQFYFGE